MSSTSRWFSITVFGIVDGEQFTDHRIQQVFDILRRNHFRYVGQHESGSNTHREHLQLAIYSDLPIRSSALQTKLAELNTDPFRYHGQAARSPGSLIAYVTKQDTRLSGPYYSTPPPPIARATSQSLADCSDTDVITDTAPAPKRPNASTKNPKHRRLFELLSSGVSIKEILTEFPEHTLRLSQLQAASLFLKPPLPPERNIVVKYLYGAAGSGKTSYVYHMGIPFHRLGTPQVLFDGYLDQDLLLVDDLTENTLAYENLLEICDRYTIRRPIKYGSIVSHWTQVVITSNYAPDQFLYHSGIQDEHRRQAFYRRLHFIVEFCDATIRNNMKYDPSSKQFVFDSPSDIPPLINYST